MIFQITQPFCKNGISLHILNETHIDQLIKISRDERIWRFGIHNFCDEKIFREKWIKKAFSEMENNQRVCFSVFQDEKIIGSSSFYHIDSDNKKLSMGYTFFHPNFWGTNVNPLTKLMMFEYAFEQLNYNRIELTVDSMNLSSCNSLKKIGIQQEGILRNHMVLFDGRIRHSVIF